MLLYVLRTYMYSEVEVEEHMYPSELHWVRTSNVFFFAHFEFRSEHKNYSRFFAHSEPHAVCRIIRERAVYVHMHSKSYTYLCRDDLTGNCPPSWERSWRSEVLSRVVITAPATCTFECFDSNADQRHRLDFGPPNNSVLIQSPQQPRSL